MPIEARQAYDQLKSAVERKADKAEVGSLVFAFRNAIAYTESQFAQEAKVKLLTVQRWEQSESIPQAANLAAMEEMIQRREGKGYLPLRGYSWTQIIARQKPKDVRKIWVFGRSKFLEGQTGEVSNQIVSFLSDPHKAILYVALGLSAYQSFLEFQRRIQHLSLQGHIYLCSYSPSFYSQPMEGGQPSLLGSLNDVTVVLHESQDEDDNGTMAFMYRGYVSFPAGEDALVDLGAEAIGVASPQIWLPLSEDATQRIAREICHPIESVLEQTTSLKDDTTIEVEMPPGVWLKRLTGPSGQATRHGSKLKATTS